MKGEKDGKDLDEEVKDRSWVLVGWRGGWVEVDGGGVNSHSSSLHGAEMILLTPEL